MPDIEPLSLAEAAAELAGAQPSRLDDRGFRVDDDATPQPKEPKPKQKYSALLDDAEDGVDESQPTVDEDLEDEVEDDDDEASDSDEVEQSTLSTIDPPKSFTSEEIAEFKSLPPEVQKTVVRREGERDRAFMSKMNQVAEERNGLTPLAQKLQNEQQNFMHLTELVIAMGVPEVNEYQNMDWVALAKADPVTYTEKRAGYEALQQKLQLVAQNAAQVKQQQNAQYQQAYQQQVNEQLGRLLEEVPEFRDKTKATALVSNITKSLSEYGFSPDELNSIVDSRVVKLIADFSKMKAAEQNRQSALKKKTAQPAPRVMQPNASSNGRSENKTTKAKQAWDKLNKSGDIWDAVRVMQLR